MSRSDQHIGLTNEARNWLKDYEIKPEICSECGRPQPIIGEVIGYYFGMFDNKYPLHRHFLITGHYADEFLQCSPWSSGPTFFIGLKVSDGTTFKWTDDKIEEML